MEKAILLDGSAVQSAEAAADEGTPDKWNITVTLTKDGAERFAKITGEGEPPADFLVREESALGAPGFVDLLGIESPGLTACLALARHVRTLLRGH